MLETQSMSINYVAILVFGLLAVFVAVVIGGAVGLLTRRHSASHEAGNQRRRSGAVGWLFAVVGCSVFLLVAFLGVWTKGRQVTHRAENAVRLPSDSTVTVQKDFASHTVRVTSDASDLSESEDLTPDGSVSESPPDWTAQTQRIIEAGQVPRILFVASSELCATEEEARQEAEAAAIATLHDRLSPVYSQYKDWPIPADVFETVALKQSFTQKTMHRFGSFVEPMYQVYLQFEDSADVREPIAEQWQQSAVSGRVGQYAIGMGVLALLLGMSSAVMRGIAAPSGHKRGPVVTAVALGVGAVAALFIQ
jgi:hypothetical protein